MHVRRLAGLLILGIAAAARADEQIDFARDVRPILSNACFECHGPDAANRQSDLRLDVQEGAFRDLGGYAAIVPRKADASELIRRVTAEDASMRMPPADAGKQLTPDQIATLRKWIEQGARWSGHWAFSAPQRPDLPALSRPEWVRNPIDAFVLARLEREGLTPSPEADRVTLLRRLSLDLIGLPPTIAEIDAFLADESPHAYERQVERLLRSPHYGERWGRHWLDAARYADSDGFEKDKPRFVWFYRDWVINALNRDLPYDQFIVEQIAGDLLPGASQDQIVATGFLRNSMINEEGGVDPEQFRMEAMFDRMDAIGKGILGLTIQCAQCHTHKYDPLTQEEYYRMFAFINNSHEGSISVYTREEQHERDEIFRRIREIENDLQQCPDWRDRMVAWEDEVCGDQPEWTVVRPELDASGGQKHYLLDDGSILAQGYAPTKHTTEFTVKVDGSEITAVRLELLNDPNLPRNGPGRSIYGLCALTEFHVVAAPADNPGEKHEIKIASVTADVNPDERELDAIFDDRGKERRVTGPIEYAIDRKDETAWGIEIGGGRSNVPREAVFVFEKPVSFPAGAILTFKLKQAHGGWNSDDNQNNNLGRFRFSVTSAESPTADPLPQHVRELLSVPPTERSPEQQREVFSFWRTTVPDWKEANGAIEALWREHPRGHSQLVLQERKQPRTTHVLERGSFLSPAAPVEPGVPEFLHPFPKDAPLTRLTFARWLADRRSPTTARALVNRAWQTYFGTGIVATSEDLGLQSEAPSHPDLLDWLAVEFMDRGWSQKQLHRLIVTSSTYRQSCDVTPELLARDPYNRLLARGARLRVEAETVRDIALAASGLLNPQVGGPSVHPPAPDFLFVPPASYGPKVWNEDSGPDRHRRAIYTFRYRSVPYPMLQNFDAPNGDFACVRRARSNTPLQALTTLNEPLFVECARALAVLAVTKGGSETDERLRYAFRRCVGREPADREAAILTKLLDEQTERFASGSLDPWGLIAADREHPPELPLDAEPSELAAWTAVARVLLNLDETITKE